MEQNEDFFLKFWPKSRLIENFDQIQDFPKILTKIEIYVHFLQKSRFLKNFG